MFSVPRYAVVAVTGIAAVRGPSVGRRPTGSPRTSVAPVEVRSGDVSVGGVRSRVLEAGPATPAEAVVFVHGNPGSCEDWRRLLGRAGDLGRAIALDMPGFGRADKPDDFDYGVPGYARFLDGALAALGVRRAHLVLHDFGGPFGLAWATARPDAVGSLGLIDTGVLEGYRWHYAARVWRTPVLGELSQAAMTRRAFRVLLRHGNPRGLPREFVDRMFDDYDAGTRRAVLRLYRATDATSAGPRLGAALGAIHAPVLVIWGAHDPYLPVTYADRQRETFTHAHVCVLSGSGHWPFVDDPEAVERIAIPFLRRALGAGLAT